MHRRALLTRVAGLSAVGFAGCVADGPGAGRQTPAPTTDADADATASDEDADLPGTTADDTPDGTATDSPPDGSPDSPATPPHDAPFPPNRDDVDEVVWFREVSNPDGALVLEHDAASVALPDAEIGFTLRNGTDRTFETNFYGWALYRWEAGRWHRVAPMAVPQPLMRLPSGESHGWTLVLDDRDLEAPLYRSQGTTDVAVGAVGGGSYAFAIDGWWPDQPATPSYEHQTVRAARFRLVGDRLPLVSSSAVTGTRYEGDAVVVEATNPRGEDGEAYGEPGTYVLTRDEEATDPRRVITEQVYRQWPLRDALAHADDGVREVRVETRTGVVPPFGVQADEDPAVSYDGRTYRITAETSGSGE